MVKQETAYQGMCRNLPDGNLKNQVRPLLFGEESSRSCSGAGLVSCTAPQLPVPVALSYSKVGQTYMQCSRETFL